MLTLSGILAHLGCAPVSLEVLEVGGIAFEVVESLPADGIVIEDARDYEVEGER